MINCLSLFSGIGAFESALDRAGIEYNLVNYCEIDPYASKSYAAVHGIPESKNLRDVTTIKADTIADRIDLITYGFPYQDISVAGKMRGFTDAEGNTTRSGLFFEALRIIKDYKPAYAIAENVKALTGKKFEKEFKIVLDSLEEAGYNNYWKVLNAKDYANVPQNRERVFIVSIRKDVDAGAFEFPQPVELTKRLKDVLEQHVDEKYYLSDKMLEKLTFHVSTSEYGVINVADVNKGGQRGAVVSPDGVSSTLTATDYKQPKQIAIDKSVNDTREISVANCLTAREDRGVSNRKAEGTAVLEIREATLKGYAEAEVGDCINLEFPNSQTRRGRVSKGMANTLTTSCNQAILEQVGQIYPNSGNPQAGRVYNSDGLSPALDTCQGGNRMPKITEPVCLNSKGGRNGVPGLQPSLQDRVYDSEAVSTAVTTSFMPSFTDHLRIRKLTPKECWRLMGFTDEEFERAQSAGISNSQLYKQAGNSIVVELLTRVFEHLFLPDWML